MITESQRIENLKTCLETLQERSIYYGSMWKEYKSPSHRGYVIALDNIIGRYRRALYTNGASGDIIESITKLKQRLDNYLIEKKLKFMLDKPKDKDSIEMAEAEIDKIESIKIEIHDILTEV